MTTCLLVGGLLVLGAAMRLEVIDRLAPLAREELGFDAYYYYVSAAEALVEGRGLDPAYNHRDPVPPYFVPPPLQSVFIAIVYRVFGVGNLEAVYRVQLILNLMAGLVLGWMLWRRWGWAAGLVGLAGWMVYPEFYSSVYEPMTESNYLFLLVMSLALLMRWEERRTVGWAVASGLAIGLMNLQRPLGMLLGGVLGVYALLSMRGRARWIHAGVFLVVPWLVLTPWLVRNMRLNGDAVWVSSNGGMLLYAVNHAEYDPVEFPAYSSYPVDRWRRKDIVARFYSPEFADRRTAHQLSKMYMEAAVADMLAHPLHTIKIQSIKLWQRFVLYPRSFEVMYPGLPKPAGMIVFYSLLGTGICGLLRGCVRRRDARGVLGVMLVCFAYFAAFNALLHWLASGRLTVPLRVFLLIYAAVLVQRVSRPDKAAERPADCEAAPSDGTTKA